MNIPRNFRGTKNYIGEEAINRLALKNIIRDTLILFGFEPLETPMIEREETLAGKYGEEGEMKRFKLSLPFLQAAGLRYDLTLPLAKVVAQNWNSLSFPYRRFAIELVARNEASSGERLREFTQCDFDTVGSESPLVDTEIVSLNYFLLNRLGFGDTYTIQINDRRLLDAITQSINLNKKIKMLVYRSWDNIQKKNWESILDELRNSSDGEDQLDEDTVRRIDSITRFLTNLKPQSNEEKLQSMRSFFSDNTEVLKAISEIANLLDLVRVSGVPEKCFEFNPLLARGLDYYTGPIFETIIKEEITKSLGINSIGSITGGGRFDNLIEQLGGPSLPASGSSFGFDRIYDVMVKLQIPFPKEERPNVFIAVFKPDNPELIIKSLQLATKLRLDGIVVEVYNGNNQVGKQVKLALKKGYANVAFIGQEESETNTVSIKNLLSREQTSVSVEEATSFLLNNPTN